MCEQLSLLFVPSIERRQKGERYEAGGKNNKRNKDMLIETQGRFGDL